MCNLKNDKTVARYLLNTALLMMYCNNRYCSSNNDNSFLQHMGLLDFGRLI